MAPGPSRTLGWILFGGVVVACPLFGNQIVVWLLLNVGVFIGETGNGVLADEIVVDCLLWRQQVSVTTYHLFIRINYVPRSSLYWEASFQEELHSKIRYR